MNTSDNSNPTFNHHRPQGSWAVVKLNEDRYEVCLVTLTYYSSGELFEELDD